MRDVARRHGQHFRASADAEPARFVNAVGDALHRAVAGPLARTQMPERS